MLSELYPTASTQGSGLVARHSTIILKPEMGARKIDFGVCVCVSWSAFKATQKRVTRYPQEKKYQNMNWNPKGPAFSPVSWFSLPHPPHWTKHAPLWGCVLTFAICRARENGESFATGRGQPRRLLPSHQFTPELAKRLKGRGWGTLEDPTSATPDVRDGSL